MRNLEDITYFDPEEETTTLGQRLSKELTPANAFSLAKPLLVFAANKVDLQSRLYKPLMVSSFIADALDGRVARRYGKSPHGGVIDVVTDHAAEAMMYAHLSDEGIVPRWVPLMTGVRNIATDVFRESHIVFDSAVIEEENGVLQLNTSNFAKKVVGSRVSRVGYGALKMAVSLTAPERPELSKNLSKIAAGVSLIRGLPVIFNRENIKLLRGKYTH